MAAQLMQKVAMCADEATLQHPETVGLMGENFESQPWLRLFSSPEAARAALRISHDIEEVWVVSSDVVAPINLAATLKSDRPDRPVFMLTLQGSGSLSSRSVTAGIDGHMSHQAFVKRYVQWKQNTAANMAAVASLNQQSTAVPVKEGQATVAAVPVRERLAAAVVAPAKERPVAAPYTFGAASSMASAASIASALSPAAQLARAQAQNGSKTQYLPVVSGSGGAGKSTVSALLALVAAARGISTLLVDYDLQFGDLARYLGQDEPVHIDELLANPSAVDRLVCQGGKPAFLASPKQLEDAATVAERATELLEALSGKFDLIVFNTGAFWAEQHAALLERATKAVFLIDQRSSSLRACQHALDLCARLGIASSPFSFVLNKCTKGSPFTAIDASCALRGAHVYELRDGAGEVDELMEASMASALLEENNVLAEDIESLLSELLPTLNMQTQDVSPSAGISGLLGKRSKRRRRGV